MKISEFWQGFKKEYAPYTDSYAAYAFGEDADELAQLEKDCNFLTIFSL